MPRTTPQEEIVCPSCSLKTGRHTKGLCPKCYQRWLRHGHTEATRPEDWGAREKHPLYNQWTWHKRKAESSICTEWKDNFWGFVKAVGKRPSPEYTLVRLNSEELIGPDNFEWKRKDKFINSIPKAERNAAYQRRHRENNQATLRDAALKKNYRLSLDEYDQMLEDQGGVCDICGNPETCKIKGRTISLAVDHCHETDRVRGLLCSTCNPALGSFKDSIQTLQKAIQYLEKHN